MRDMHLDDDTIEKTKCSRGFPINCLLHKREQLTNFIEKIEKSTRNQSDAHENYTFFINFIKKEMHQKVDFKTINIKTGINNNKKAT